MLNNKALAASLSAGPKTYVEDVFSTYLYTGNGATQTITNGIDLASKGGLVWNKSRSLSGGSGWHFLYDTDRGVDSLLATNSTASAYSITTDRPVSSFNSNGFTTNYNGSWFSNNSGSTYASWTFRKAAKFFDVVTWTGDGTNNRSINHSLSSNPGVIIVKRTDSTSNWAVYSPASLWTGESYTGLYLNTTGTIGSTTVNGQGISAVSTTSFTVISSGSNPLEFNPNVNGATYVAYLFASNAGGFGDSGNDNVISCGSMTNAAPVNLGWEPQFVLLKRTDSTGSWFLLDTLRGFDSSTNSAALFANLSDAEASAGYGWSLNATGFSGAAGGTYIYIAIRRGPMKTPTDATKVFSLLTQVGTGVVTSLSAGFPVDLVLSRQRFSAGSSFCSVVDRLRGVNSAGAGTGLLTQYTQAEVASYSNEYVSFDVGGITVGTGPNQIGNASNAFTMLYHFFRRAPGFFDVVAYTGTGSVRTVAHNLGVAPELMIIKSRSTARNWQVYFGNNLAGLILNSTLFAQNTPDYWNDTSPTAAVFTVGQGLNVNESGAGYIAYLFATCPGVSKVGSYTGTGNSTFNVNCGFTTGARFVLIKRTDSTGDWYVWDSARGLTVFTAPYLLFNSTAAEVTNTTYINSISTGFGVSAGSPEIPVNITGASYIYLAIA